MTLLPRPARSGQRYAAVLIPKHCASHRLDARRRVPVASRPVRLCLARCTRVCLDRTGPGAHAMLARRKILQGLAATALATIDGRLGRAETYPTRPVRVIVTTGPGGQG